MYTLNTCMLTLSYKTFIYLMFYTLLNLIYKILQKNKENTGIK